MTFKENLMKDLEYIAYKAVIAINKVLNTTHTFTEPLSVKALMNSYRVDNSSVLSWAYNKNITTAKLTSTKVDELYSEYSVWCDVNGFKTVRSTRFEAEISSEFKLDKQDDMFVDK
jgi:phage/plasmid-associated DNA primase